MHRLYFQDNGIGYYKWDESIGGWAQDENGEEVVFSYDAAGTAVIILLHIGVLAWIPFYFIKSLILNGKAKFAHWTEHAQAIIFAKKLN